ncbi:hypothetical protein FWJ25_15880 [Marinobacter salinexigens]|uniref:Nucleoside-diphosphate sugar epimerase n=1 Tax=Marinobacter salinexigens TaxID=2919747 RepID=A0A5B0VC72_9GAMM|nr:ELM1/GtrOC1 family putative glycosyltransferase [Marinobacter salinexigens]KAA1171631.1 hypothetical protein FWJ25_15880 [Marinobacter salinexigens]
MGRQQDHHDQAPVVWLLTDNKPGHRNQLKGLGNRLRVLTGASLHWVEIPARKVPLWRVILARPPKQSENLPNPDLIIAAGTGTHRLLLALRKSRNAKTMVIMKPGFPVRWVNAAAIPSHDHPASSPRILTTQGVINTVTPLARVTNKPEALILIGGPSPHFEWDSDSIFSQTQKLIMDYPQWRWTISGSRRTPDDLLTRLEELANLKVTVVDHRRTHESWLNHQLPASRAVWVTPDSMSMVCEAVTSGIPTGLLELPAKTGSRVAEGIMHLVKEGLASPVSDHEAVMSGRHTLEHGLWEADRAARWVISRRLLPLPLRSGKTDKRTTT